MVIRYIRRGGEYVPVDENGRVLTDQKSYERKGPNPKGGDGLIHNNGVNRGSEAEFDKLMLAFLNEGRILTPDELGAKNGAAAYKNLTKDFESLVQKNNINKDEYIDNFNKYGKGTLTNSEKQNLDKYGKINPTDQEKKDFVGLSPEDQEKFKDGNLNTGGSNTGSGDAPENDPYGMKDLFDFDTEGSTANKLYEMYKEINQGQYDSAKLESQYQERDMNKLISGERQALMDQIREDRRRGLKSGLSQSAIANREIQGLLQGQAMASGLGEEFLSERRQLNSMGQNIDAMSKGQVIDGYNQGLGNVISGNRAAGAGDFYSQFLNWRNSSARERSLYDEYNNKYGSGQK